MQEQERGLLIVAHGSDVEGSEQELFRIMERVRRGIGCEVAVCGFLRTNAGTRSIPEAIQVCAEQGVTALWVMPYFLTAGYLQKKAVRLAEQAAREHGLRLHVAPPLGLHPLLTDVVLQRIDEAWNGAPEE